MKSIMKPGAIKKIKECDETPEGKEKYTAPGDNSEIVFMVEEIEAVVPNNR